MNTIYTCGIFHPSLRTVKASTSAFKFENRGLEKVLDHIQKHEQIDHEKTSVHIRHDWCLLVWPSHLDRVKRIWYLSPMRAAKVQASLRIRAVSPEPPLLTHTSSESRGTFRQKARSLASLNGWACAVKTCHDGMLEDTNSLDGAHFIGSLAWYVLRRWFLGLKTLEED